MDDPQQRRRRPVTYGKPSRKRLSDIDEIFSSPDASSPRLSTPSTAGAGGAARAPALPPPSAKASNASIRNPTERLQAAVTRDKKRPTLKVPNPKPLTTTTTTTTAPTTCESSHSSDEAEGQSPTDIAAAAQLQFEAQSSHGSDLGVFDFPSSDNEHSATRPTLKRKRAQLVPPKPPSRVTHKVNTPSASESTTTETEDMIPKSKRPRGPTRKKPEEPVGGPLKKLTAGKITKPWSRPAPQKGKEKTPVQPQAWAAEYPPIEPSGALDAAPKRTHVTRSQSRQLSEEPSARPVKPATFEEARPRPLQKKIEATVPDGARRSTATATLSEPPPPNRKSSSLGKPKVVMEKNLRGIPDGDLLAGNIARKAIKTKSVAAKIKPIVRSKAKDESSIGKIFGFFAEELTPVARPRKRLIDSLGAGQEGPCKKGCSSSTSEASGRGGSQEDSQDFDGFGSQSQSQSQGIFGSQETPSQEATIMAIQRQMTGNGRAGPKVTYARQRSYRAEGESGSLEDMLNMALPSVRPMQPTRRRLEHPTPKEDDDEVKEAKKSKSMIKNIHELRAAGERSRFVDDVEDLFLDIEGNCPLSTKRLGYMVFASRLCDKSFNHKFRTNSFDERLLTKMDQEVDEISCFALSYLTLSFLHDDSTPRTMLHVWNNGVMLMLARMLSSSRDINLIAKDRKTNMSKIAVGQVAEFRALVEKSTAFSGMDSKVISPQILALKVLDVLVRKFRGHGSSDDILSRSVLRGLVGILAPFTASKEYPKSLQTQGLQALALPVSTLEAYTMGGYGSLEAHVSKGELVTLTNLFPVVSNWNCDEDLGEVLLLLLRLNINITNNRPVACEIIADTPLIGSLVALIKGMFEKLSGVLEEQERLLSVDLLVLSLGLMLNFAEFSPKARAAVGDKVVSSVEGNPLGIDILLDIFLERLEHTAEADSMEESHTNVAFGYLAVLLGDLCQEDHIRYKARGRLPNSSLKCLLGAVEEFIAHHRKVDENMFGTVKGGDEPELENDPVELAEFTTKLQHIMVRLRAYA